MDIVARDEVDGGRPFERELRGVERSCGLVMLSGSVIIAGGVERAIVLCSSEMVSYRGKLCLKEVDMMEF